MTGSSRYMGAALAVVHVSILLRLALLSALLGSSALTAQTSPVAKAGARPPILGTFDKGKYSNPIIGFELQLDAACALADEDRAIAWSTNFSQRLNLALRCGDDLILLSSFPLHPDETLNLRRDTEVSVEGAIDGGGFKRRDRLQSHVTGGTEMFVQELTRRGDSGQELGFYSAFMVGRRYVSIFAIGPKTDEGALRQAAANLRIEPRAVATDEGYGPESLVWNLVVAEITYATTNPDTGFTCSLSSLGEGFIDAKLASGQKSSYAFGLQNCTSEKPGGPNTKFQVTASPLLGKPGAKAFCSDDSGVIRTDPNGSVQGCLDHGLPLE